MAPRKDEDHYAAMIAAGTKKITILQRRVGTGDRWCAIATCSHDVSANLIVEALNLRQGRVEKLEVPAQRTLVDVREQLTKERALTSQLRDDVRRRDNDIREQKHALENAKRDLANMEKRAIKAETPPPARTADNVCSPECLKPGIGCQCD